MATTPRPVDYLEASSPERQWEILKSALKTVTSAEEAPKQLIEGLSHEQRMEATRRRMAIPNGFLYQAELRDQKSEAGLNVFEIGYPDAFLGALPEEEFVDFEVVLDSGAGAHVVSVAMIPGYVITESELSRAGAGFVAADGGRMPNLGEAHLHFVTKDSNGVAHEVNSKFQVADVTRALWSVGVICDSGLNVKFSKERAVVLDENGVELCMFQRKNGLYVAQVRLRNPLFKGFQRPGSSS